MMSHIYILSYFYLDPLKTDQIKIRSEDRQPVDPSTDLFISSRDLHQEVFL